MQGRLGQWARDRFRNRADSLDTGLRLQASQHLGMDVTIADSRYLREAHQLETASLPFLADQDKVGRE